MNNNDIKSLERLYLKAKVAYYDGNPIMTDSTFDALEEKLKMLGSKIIEQVGSKRKDFDFPHPTKMLSLSKIQTEENNYKEKEFIDWFNDKIKIIGKPISYLIFSPKFDGSAINIIYKNKLLESVLTRGDGYFGKDVTDRFSEYLPKTIDEFDGIVEIRCEAVMPKSIFKEKYADKFANARNIVAGIIGKDEIDIEKIKDLILIPVNLLVNGKYQNITLLENFIKKSFIFSKTLYTNIIKITPQNYINTIKIWEIIRKDFNIQLDGIVFSFYPEYREILGENEHDPEWAIAIKFVPEEVITEVIGIEWNLGKTGELTPVIQLSPVKLAGTIVKRVSGYNAGYIIKNKIGPGTYVSITKAGDIIPEIQEVKIKTSKTFILPDKCPICGSKLKFDNIHLYCNNEECIGKTSRKLASICAILNLKGIAEKTIEPFAKDFNNMYELFMWILKNYNNKDFSLEKYGIKKNSRSHEIFVNAFKNIKSLTYSQVILMMGYEGVGKKLAEQVAKDYCGLETDYKGHEKTLIEKFKNKDIESYIKNAISELESLGIIVDKPVLNNNDIYICMTGSPKEHGFKTKEEFISKFSNVKEVSITDPKCNYLITDSLNSISGKMKIAKKLGKKIITYSEFLNLYLT